MRSLSSQRPRPVYVPGLDGLRALAAGDSMPS